MKPKTLIIPFCTIVIISAFLGCTSQKEELTQEQINNEIDSMVQIDADTPEGLSAVTKTTAMMINLIQMIIVLILLNQMHSVVILKNCVMMELQ